MRLFNSARQYHQRTRFSFNSVKEVYREVIPDDKKLPVKQYTGKPTIDLPRDFELDRGNLDKEFQQILKFRKFHRLQSDRIPIEDLSHLLHASNGITLEKETGGKKLYYRASPSASSTYPVEIYVVANQVENLESGLYYYHPVNHQLVEIQKGNIQDDITTACFNLESIQQAPLFILFSGIYDRNRWRYQDRAFRYTLMETGYILENLALAGACLDYHVNIIGDFVDDAVNRILQIDSEEEAGLLVTAIGKSGGKIVEESYTFSMPGESDDTLQTNLENMQASFYRQSSHYPADEKAVNIQVRLPFEKVAGERITPSDLIGLPDDPGQRLSKSTLQTIENRRSAHFFNRTSINVTHLSALLHQLQNIPALYNYQAFHTYLVSNDVENLTHGLYRYFPQFHQLQLIKRGTYRGDISYLTLAQDAVFNCSVAFFFAVDFEEIDIFSNRGYRYAHFNVGMLSEAIYVAGTGMELAVRGISNFFDDDLNNFFSMQSPSKQILGGVIVGRS
ncbi:MAG: SagB/ThcOx family dehydrogenase [bacterium]|nr:MAG: SagB/ThcOx family dehydrogenase [bacterium]